jgi:hypothetical protein
MTGNQIEIINKLTHDLAFVSESSIKTERVLARLAQAIEELAKSELDRENENKPIKKIQCNVCGKAFMDADSIEFAEKLMIEGTVANCPLFGCKGHMVVLS